MKLTPELVAKSPSSINTLRERELVIRGLKIPAIENLGVTQDQNDALDLTDNDIRALSGFPLLKRLTSLTVANNLIHRIDPQIAHSLPCLESLVLTNNQIADLGELVALSKFPSLTYLSLLGNPVAREKHYRDWVIWKCPKVRVLDFKRVKDKERQYAKTIFQSEEGRQSALAVSLAYRSNRFGESSSSAAARTDNTFEPGQVKGANGTAGRLLTPAERKAIETAIDQSDSLETIRRLEEKLRLGYAIDDIVPSSSAATDASKAAKKDGADAAEGGESIAGPPVVEVGDGAGAGAAEDAEADEEAEEEADTSTAKGRGTKRKAAAPKKSGGSKKRK
ncbi:hypothetical protein V8E36_000470 [Tilletia maclaganii]